MSTTKVRILSAIAAGIIMVGGAWLLNQKSSAMQEPAASEDASGLSIRKHIPVSDSDRDGVPDWQDKLIDSEPIYLDELSTTSEPFVPPDTLTGQISYKFFHDLMILDLYGLVEDAGDELVEGAIAEMEEATQERIYTKDDLVSVVKTNSQGALRAYGNLVAGTIFFYQTNDANEFQIYQQMTEDKNPRHLERLAVIEKQYDDIITALVKLEVPEDYVFEHLAVVNALSALKQNTYAMQLFFDDPFYASIRYRRLADDVLALNDAITNLYNRLHGEERIQFADNETLPVMVELLQ